MRYVYPTVRQSVVVVSLAVALSVGVVAQQRPLDASQGFDMGRGMSPLNGDLMQIAIQSDFFLSFGQAISLTAEQQKSLEEVYFEIQRYTVRRKADLDVADAELRRLLSSDRVDLAAVQAKVKQTELIQSEATVKRIKAALRAINTLTHEQHLKVLLLVRQKLQQELPLRDG